jgi:hypothetical protein
MACVFSKISLVTVAFLLVSSVASAQEVALSDLRCAPISEGTGGSAEVSCPATSNGQVNVEQCSCAAGFVLVQISAPAAIGVKPLDVSQN